jgi:amino acid transporter
MTELSSPNLDSASQKPRISTENPPPPPPHISIGVTTGDPATSPARTVNQIKKITVLPLVFLIFYEVSGGPFGIEDSVKAAGPLLAIVGFIVFPFIWSIPEALITAEMGTMFPENGGYVVWVTLAMGP